MILDVKRERKKASKKRSQGANACFLDLERIEKVASVAVWRADLSHFAIASHIAYVVDLCR